MKSIRKLVYTAVISLSSLSFTANVASAQEAAGRFTLAHDVHWQDAVVPAGEYRFTIEPKGPSKLLFIREASGRGTGFLVVAQDTESENTSEPGRLMLVSRSGASYVSAMELPAWGMTLHFAVPSDSSQKQIAQAGTASSASSAR